MTILLEARQLTKVFGGGLFARRSTTALLDFSLRVDTEPPSITAIVGESGSGKTTLARLLLGVIDDSSCRLDYELHTRDPGAATVAGSVRYPPGGLLFFDGDKLRHRITPLAHGETRISLTFEYVTDPSMRSWWRLISNMKDAVAYFGLRQVFRKAIGARTERP